MNAKRTPTKYIAYYRVSTDRQGRSGLGLEAQMEAVRLKLEGTGGYPPLMEFTETESGRKNDRPELEKALKACRVHNATLIIAKLDRLSRNQQFLMSLAEGKVPVVFCDFDLPIGTAGWMMLNQMAFVAELEARMISDRTKAALRAKVARDGQWDRKSKHHLVPGVGQPKAAAASRAKADARAADLADMMKAMLADGLSLNSIAATLNEQGVSTARNGKWTATAVKRTAERAGLLQVPVGSP